MPLIKRVHTAYLFPTGVLAICDVSGNQIGELQGSYSIELHKRIILEAADTCEFKGFNILPSGFIKHAKDWADHFRSQNMSWEDIEKL